MSEEKCPLCGAECLYKEYLKDLKGNWCGDPNAEYCNQLISHYLKAHDTAVELKKEKEEWILRCAEWQDVNTELEEEIE